MILFQNERVGCEQCIRGHRAADCQHLDKPLVSIKNRGKPTDRSMSVRLKMSDNPEVIRISEEQIESKNGRCREGITKKCYHLNPNTTCCFFIVSIRDGFSLVGPVKDTDPYYHTFKININEGQNIKIVPPSPSDFSIGSGTDRSNTTIVKKEKHRNTGYKTVPSYAKPPVSAPRQETAQNASLVPQNLDQESLNLIDLSCFMELPSFKLRDGPSDVPDGQQASASADYFQNLENEIEHSSTVNNTIAQSADQNDTNLKDQTSNTNAISECGCSGVIGCPHQMLAIGNSTYDPHNTSGGEQQTFQALENTNLPPVGDASRYYDFINYGRERHIQEQNTPNNTELLLETSQGPSRGLSDPTSYPSSLERNLVTNMSYPTASEDIQKKANQNQAQTGTDGNAIDNAISKIVQPDEYNSNQLELSNDVFELEDYINFNSSEGFSSGLGELTEIDFTLELANLENMITATVEHSSEVNSQVRNNLTHDEPRSNSKTDRADKTPLSDQEIQDIFRQLTNN